jgi:hypothetical protein
LNTSAPPNFPNDAHVAPETVPAFPLPDKSPTDDPDPSSNENAATNPDVADPDRDGNIRTTLPESAATTNSTASTRPTTRTRRPDPGLKPKSANGFLPPILSGTLTAAIEEIQAHLCHDERSPNAAGM